MVEEAERGPCSLNEFDQLLETRDTHGGAGRGRTVRRRVARTPGLNRGKTNQAGPARQAAANRGRGELLGRAIFNGCSTREAGAPGGARGAADARWAREAVGGGGGGVFFWGGSSFVCWGGGGPGWPWGVGPLWGGGGSCLWGSRIEIATTAPACRRRSAPRSFKPYVTMREKAWPWPRDRRANRRVNHWGSNCAEMSREGPSFVSTTAKGRGAHR